MNQRKLNEKNCGDYDTVEIYEKVKQLKPAYLVRGNNDCAWAKEIPNAITVTIEETTIYIVHDRREIPKDLSGISLVVFGHSHQYEEDKRNQVIFLNPGSCGKRRFHYKLSMAMVTVDGKDISIEKIPVVTEEKS